MAPKISQAEKGRTVGTYATILLAMTAFTVVAVEPVSADALAPESPALATDVCIPLTNVCLIIPKTCVPFTNVCVFT